ncbi:hypothetical protein QUA82_02330 [Microcoleus sp. F8-D3]
MTGLVSVLSAIAPILSAFLLPFVSNSSTEILPIPFPIELQKWMKIFSEEQILILKSEDLFAYPQKNLNTLFKFLDTHEHNINNFYIYENKGNCPTINDNLRRRLCEFFLPHNQLLEEYLGRKLYWD